MLTEELETFIRIHVKSLSALELLLLIHRSRGRSWSADELNRELRSTLQLVGDVLDKFERAGLVRRDTDQRYHWEPANPELQRVVGQLEETHSKYPFSVVEVIYATPVEKIQVLADAFKFKKD